MAISGELLVEPKVLAAQAGEVERLVTLMKNGFDDLERYVRNTNSYWVGEAGNVHREKYINMKPNIEQAIKRLNEHVNDLRVMAGIYEEAENAANMEAQGLVESVIE